MLYARLQKHTGLGLKLSSIYVAESFSDYGDRKGKVDEILLLYELCQLAPVKSR